MVLPLDMTGDATSRLSGRRFDGVIFDMDGTLVEPLLDFAAMRRRLCVPPGQGILEAIEDMPPSQRSSATRWLVGQELAAAARAKLLPGAAEAVDAIRRAGLKTALMTRNTRPAMGVVLARLMLQFDLAWSREDGPVKPSGEGILLACRRLEISPVRTACVGDFQYDVQAANAVGAYSILLAAEALPPWADQAKCVISSLFQLPQVLGIIAAAYG
jgi:phosphoglycolate phosphatase-like HAD superfamily hydrolase